MLAFCEAQEHIAEHLIGFDQSDNYDSFSWQI